MFFIEFLQQIVKMFGVYFYGFFGESAEDYDISSAYTDQESDEEDTENDYTNYFLLGETIAWASQLLIFPNSA